MKERNYKQIKTYDEIFDAFNALKNEFYSFDGKIEELAEKIYTYGVCFVCEKAETCGIIAFYANDDKKRIAFISSVLVLKSQRGCGIATHLMKLAEDYCLQLSFNKIRLEVNQNNCAAISLYEKLGYKKAEFKNESVFMEKSLV